ncbi:rRNA maturation RNase YbeY [Haloferula rosea]|uniref:Endoribonuclease YbeY n=1 Tax=Haloferula rosea TaxID=490093 RepID=A0A934VGU9_9BACT|nr:rRNA maturation RNase YbeY [Haloferula rosea]MBK1828421.1 rRNA maturation RNase YbeY [Haloferula rosea]
MSVQVNVGNHQDKVRVGERLLLDLERCGHEAAAQVLAEHVKVAGAPLTSLEEVDVEFVDDEASARVHEDFMGVPGATDVITFEHGEIVIGIEVVQRQAAEFGEPEAREAFRYLVHGLLHLAGHEDELAEDRAVMEKAQEAVVARCWTGGQDLFGS